MKTIEKASLEYSNKVNGNHHNWLFPNCDETIGEVCIHDFKAGVKFAQRWIPVEEEKPPIGVDVIVKCKDYYNEKYDILTFAGNEYELDFITHWRPINYV